MSDEVIQYLNHNALIVKKGDPSSFITYPPSAGEWFIENNHSDFWNIYCKLANGPDEDTRLFVGETLEDSMPLIIQLSLKFAYTDNDDPSDIAIPYGDDFILAFVKACQGSFDDMFHRRYCLVARTHATADHILQIIDII